MRRIFWLGSPFFNQSLKDCGWEVHAHSLSHNRVFSWEDIVSIAGWEPDVLVVADNSMPPFVLGQEHFPCLTVCYAVDTHIHSWWPWYAQSFDLCLISLRDHIPLFAGNRLRAQDTLWSPPYAMFGPVPGLESQAQCVFVGSVDAARTPARKAFLDALQKLVPVKVTFDQFDRLYSSSQVVLNICEHGDLNFRVFEAMGCGACLLTPDVGHGLHDIFTENTHFFSYPQLDVDKAAEKIHFLLQRPDLCVQTGHNALTAIDAAHRPHHRATALHKALCAYEPHRIAQRKSQATHIRETWLKIPYLLLAQSLPGHPLQKAYLAAAQGPVL